MKKGGTMGGGAEGKGGHNGGQIGAPLAPLHPPAPSTPAGSQRKPIVANPELLFPGTKEPMVGDGC